MNYKIVQLSNYEDCPNRYARCAWVYSRIASLLEGAPDALRRVARLHDHKGGLICSLRPSVRAHASDETMLVKLVVSHCWGKYGREDPGQVEFEEIQQAKA